MNPLKSLLDSFDRLITERGNSAIFRERLVLEADKYSFLELQHNVAQEKIRILELEKSKLETENSRLEKENQHLKLEIEELKKKIRGDGGFSSGVIITG